MAVITSGQVNVAWYEGTSAKVALLAVKNVTAGDTLDLGPSGATAQFRQIKGAVMLGATVIGSAAATITSGTVVTMPAGLSNDAAWVLCFGAAF